MPFCTFAPPRQIEEHLSISMHRPLELWRAKWVTGTSFEFIFAMFPFKCFIETVHLQRLSSLIWSPLKEMSDWGRELQNFHYTFTDKSRRGLFFKMLGSPPPTSQNEYVLKILSTNTWKRLICCNCCCKLSETRHTQSEKSPPITWEFRKRQKARKHCLDFASDI
jgi:hypothetical protein